MKPTSNQTASFNVAGFFKNIQQIAVTMFIAAGIYGIFDEGDAAAAIGVAVIAMGLIIITNLQGKQHD